MHLPSLAAALWRAALDWRRERRDVRLLQRSGLVDPEAYLRRYPDVSAAGIDPVLHYVRFGSREGREPGPKADVRDYLERYPDVEAAGMDPLLHYLRHGRVVGRTMRPAPQEPSEVPESGKAAPPATASPRPRRMTPLRLSAPVAAMEGGTLTLRCDMGDAPALEVRLDGPSDLLERIEPRIEPFVPVALLMAGAAGCDLHVEGPVDPDFLATLRLRYLPLLSIIYRYPSVRIEVSGTDRDSPRAPVAMPAPTDPPVAGLLFSGGVDSFYSLIRLREIGYPLRTLININAGAHDDDRVVMERRIERVRTVATQAGLDLTTIDTNFHQVLDIGHVHAHHFRTLPAAYTMFGALDRLFVANAFAYHELGFDWARQGLEMGGSTITDAIAWVGMPITEIGYEKGRFEKTRVVTEEPLAYRALDVCLSAPYQANTGPGDAVNCGRCNKCARTLLMLEHLDRLDRFRTQFDIDAFVAERDALEAQVRGRARALDQDLVNALDERPPGRPASVEVPPPSWVADERPRPAVGQPKASARPPRSGKPPLRLFWSTDRARPRPNLGDDLSPLIVERVSGRSVEWASPEECELAAIGSIAERLLDADRDRPLHLWGVGFMYAGPPISADGAQVSAMRGPLSAARIGADDIVPIGDPGLLANLLLERTPAKRQAVGIVPHVEDSDLSAIDEWANVPGAVISPRLPVLEYLEAVAACELILSSSLHGLVAADSLGVPNLWVRPSARVWGDGFKFEDHLRCVGRGTEPCQLPRPHELDAMRLEGLIDGYVPVDLDPIKSALVEAFPLR